MAQVFDLLTGPAGILFDLDFRRWRWGRRDFVERELYPVHVWTPITVQVAGCAVVGPGRAAERSSGRS